MGWDEAEGKETVLGHKMDRPQGQKRVKRRITKELSWNSKGTMLGQQRDWLWGQ